MKRRLHLPRIDIALLQVWLETLKSLPQRDFVTLMRLTTPALPGLEDAIKAVRLFAVRIIYFLLLIGLALSFVAFVCEHVYVRVKHGRRWVPAVRVKRSDLRALERATAPVTAAERRVAHSGL